MSRMWVLATLARYNRTIIFASAALLGFFAIISGLGSKIDDSIRATRYAHFPKAPSGEIVVVTIDSHTFSEFGSWPLKRGLHGTLIDRLNEAGARKIIFNVIFDQPSEDEIQDARFAQSIKRSKAQVSLAALIENVNNGKRTVEQLPSQTLGASFTPFSTWIVRGDDQIIRRSQLNTPFRGTDMRGIVQLLAGTHYSGLTSIPIDWAYAPNSVQKVPYSDVIMRRISPDRFQGKTVVIGVESAVMTDQVRVPYFGGIPDVMAHVAAAETLMAGKPIEIGPVGPVLLALLALAGLLQLPNAWRCVGFGLCVATAHVAHIAFEHIASMHLSTGPAIAIFTIALLAQLLLGFSKALLDRMTKTNEAGLPNLAAMTYSERTPANTVVVSLRNYVETTALLGLVAQGELLQKVRDRIALAAGHQQIYQINSHSFAWRTALSVENIVESLEGLEAIMLSGISINHMTVDITLNAGICEDQDIDLLLAIPRAQLAVARAIENDQLWERYETEEEEAFWSGSILSEFEQALVNGDVWVAYQPKYDAKNKRVSGAEALIRWNHPERGFIRPDKFIPILEAAGRVEKLTLYVLNQAISDFATTRQAVAVNISMRMIGKGHLAGPIAEMLKRHDMAPSRLTLEITESAALDSANGIAELIELRKMGIRISIDDYGTGQSTLTYLKRLPATELKIDQSFIRQILTSRSDAVLVDSTIKLAHELGLNVVAEGVEDENVQAKLEQMECDIIQGYHVGRPVPFHDYAATHLAQSTHAA